MVSWFANSKFREDIGLSAEEQKQIAAIQQECDQEIKEFLDSETQVRYDGTELSTELAAKQRYALIPEVNEFRISALAIAESRILELIGDQKTELCFKKLVESCGIRAILLSPNLRKQLQVSDKQFQELNDVFVSEHDVWYGKMLRNDKFKDLTTGELMLRDQTEYMRLRVKIVRDLGWAAFESVRDGKAEADEQARLLLTTDQYLRIESWMEKE
jgi:hypothetical protein